MVSMTIKFVKQRTFNIISQMSDLPEMSAK